MRFVETRLAGAFVVEIEPRADERGFFARSFCQREFEAHGICPTVAQCNVSLNATRGTVRGMHYQIAPYREAKLVRCTAGAIYDVIVDLRKESATRLEWVAVELTAQARNAIYVPEGFAHGFQSLEHDTEVFYQMSEFYAPGSGRGFRYDDPAFDFAWPLPPSIVSDADRAHPDFDPETAGR